MGNDFDDQKSRLKKKRAKLSKSIAYKVEMAIFNSKMIKQTPPSDGIEKLEIGTESKKEEVKPVPDQSTTQDTTQEVQEDTRQPDPIETTDG